MQRAEKRYYKGYIKDNIQKLGKAVPDHDSFY